MKAYAELGSELRTAREKAGRSISEVASETGLPERYVVALERGDMADLPDLSYARLYLQSYARSLRLDPESMLAAWPATRTSVPEAGPREETLNRTKPRWPLYGVGLLLLIIVVSLALFARESTAPPSNSGSLALTQRQPLPTQAEPPATATTGNTSAATTSGALTEDPTTLQEPPSESANLLARDEPGSQGVEAGLALESSTQPEVATAPTPVSPFIEPAPAPVIMRTLELVVAAQTWLVIEADGDTVVARVATRGEKVSAEARSDFRLTVANPRDLVVMLDGRPLELAVRTNRPLIRHLLPGKDTP